MVGSTVGHYQILEKLGAGGMGEIYKAQDPRLNRMVAIKVLSLASAGDPRYTASPSAPTGPPARRRKRRRHAHGPSA